MTISLPNLFVAGLVTAPVGLFLLLAQLRWPDRLALAAGVIGGASSFAFLQFILTTIDKDFMGWYKLAAWAIAVLAGYAPAATTAYAFRFVQERCIKP